MRILPNGLTPIRLQSIFTHNSARFFVALLLLLFSTVSIAAPTAYTDETEFHNALALMGYTPIHEGFEDDVAWGSVRSFITSGFKTAPSISNLGMTWTSNYVAGNVTTGEGPVRSGVYGFYSYLHGSYSTPDPGSDCFVPGECGDGWRGTADSGVFIAMGGYIDTNTPYAKLGMFLGQYPNNPVDFGESCDAEGNNCVPASVIGTAQEFFGVIDPDGFSSFEYRELEGKLEGMGGDLKYIFADDFYFVISQPPAPTVLVNPVGGLVTTESGGSNTFNVVLSAQPAADVNISLTSSNATEGTVSPAGLIFSSANWDSAQTATVTGQDDALPDGNSAYTITVAVSASADADYSGLVAIDIGVTNIDDETACCDIVYVNDDAAGNNTGESWEHAYTDLQDALSNIGSGEIWVAAGGYKPGTSRADTFQMRSHVALFGGFSGTEIARGQRDPATNISILDGDLLGDDYYRWVNGHATWSDVGDNSHHIVTGSNADATAVLDGFVLAHGYARGAGGDPGPAVQGGGGLIIQKGSPTIRNVSIEGASGAYGGGAYIFDSSPSFDDCEFRENYADIGRAGAVYIGGASSVTFTDCVFEDNAAIGTQSPDGLGGAAYIDFGASANFTGSTFSRNLVSYRTNDQGGATPTKGGAILAGGDVLVRDSYFFANKAHYGGAIYAFNGLTLINDVFDGNEATTPPSGVGGLGGALILSDLSTLIGNTITANDSAEDAGGIYLTSGADVLMVNNILWGNTISRFIPPEEDQVPIAKIQLHNGGGLVDVSYGIFEGLYEIIPGEDPTDPANFPGVVDADPLFADADGSDNISGNQDDNLRPGAGSPSIDSGDNSAVPADVLTDINGDQRFQDDPATTDSGNGTAPIVDMGAYEIGGTTPVNQPPVAMPSASPLSGEAALPVQFSSTGSYDPDGNIISYAWIFGDGGADTTPAPSYVYNTVGNYTAFLTVTDNDGDLNTNSVVITVLAPVPNQVPVAQISAVPTNGEVPLDVNFDGVMSYDGDGTIASYAWDFGDGNNGSGISTSHTYTAIGSYTARLTVTDDDGASASEAELITVTEVVPNNPPVAIVMTSATSGEAPHNVDFDGTHSYDLNGNRLIVSHDWDFGDGNSGTGIYPSHTYMSAGNFTATLTVTDDEGGTGSDTVVITVSTPPPPAETDHLASGEVIGAGTVNGDYTMTWADDSVFQAITERLSGGKKNRRYSYLVHTWQFNITAGASVTVFANAWSDLSGDGDSFVMEWSTNSSSGFQTLFVLGTDSAITLSKLIDTTGTLSGPVYIRVRDTDSTAGNTVLDKVNVDQLFIKTVTAAGDPPAAPTAMAVNAATSGTLSLNWMDNSLDETSFTIERSIDGTTFSVLTTVDVDINTFTDTGLSAGTTYWYRVFASNASGSSTLSDSASGTTLAGAAITLNASGYKVKGKKKVDLTWDGSSATNMDIYRNDMGSVHLTTANDGAVTDAIDGKGGGTWNYMICAAGTDNCSATVMVVF
jgi:PKD repeat protein